MRPLTCEWSRCVAPGAAASQGNRQRGHRGGRTAVSTDELRMDRRKFLGGAAGLAGAAAFATWAPGAMSRPGGPNSPIVTKATLSAQHFSVRDATARLDKSVKGYLG